MHLILFYRDQQVRLAVGVLVVVVLLLVLNWIRLARSHPERPAERAGLRTKQLRSPEQPYKVGLLLVFAVASAAPSVTTGDAPDKALGVGAGVVLVLLAWRAAVVRVSITDSSVTDVRLFMWRTYERTEVAEVHLGRPGGFLDGHCLVLTLTDGREAPLTASRVYSWFPVAAHLARLRELLADVRRWQEQAAGGATSKADKWCFVAVWSISVAVGVGCMARR